MINIIENPVFAYTKSGVKIIGTTDKHLLTDFNNLPYQLTVNAVPTIGQKLQVNWFGGSQTFTYVNTIDDTGNTVSQTAANTTVAALNLKNALSANFEISRDFIITQSGNTVNLLVINPEQELFLELGTGTNAPITKGANIPVRKEYNENIYIACKVLASPDSGFSTITDTLEEQYKPVKSGFELDFGKFADSNSSYFIPLITAPAPSLNFTAVNNSRTFLRLILSEYNASTNEYFANSIAEISYFKGGLASNLNQAFLKFDLPDVRNRFLSHVYTKRITENENDWFYTHHLTNGSATTLNKRVDVFFTDGTSRSYQLIANANATQNSPLFVLGGYFGAQIANQLSPTELEMLWKFSIAVEALDSNAFTVLKRDYIVEQEHYLRHQFIYVNSFGVAETLVLQGDIEQGVEINSQEFIRSNPTNSPLSDAQIDQFDKYYLNKYEVSTGLIPATEMIGLTDFLNSPEIYILESDNQYRRVLVKPTDFKLSSSAGEMRTLKIAISGTKKERGF